MTELCPFRLDPANQCLWRRTGTGGEERVLLTRTEFGILDHLAARAGQVVTHRELLDAVWPGTAIEPQVVKNKIGQAQDFIRHGLTAIDEVEAPVAGWQVHATAGAVFELLDQSTTAESHRNSSRDTILRLAASLDTYEAMRRTFLTSAAIVRVLDSAAGGGRLSA
jgi:DNA-binding winged helix-turn-helix (wHTH) protein